MLRRHIFSLILLTLVYAICYTLMVGYNLVSLTPAQLLAGAMLIGFVIAIIGPQVFSSFQSMFEKHKSSKPEENTTLYVGNLPFRTTRYELRELFQPYGKIHSARIVIDRATRKPRGYGFVEMDGKGAKKAISSLNGHVLAGRNLKVSEANERT